MKKVICKRDRIRREFRLKIMKMLVLTSLFYAALLILAAIKH